MVVLKRITKALTGSRLWFGLAFFALCYVAMWRLVEPALIYHGFGTVIADVPVFSTGWRFFAEALDIPGGLVLYLYGFLSQGYSFSPLGALIVVLMAGALGAVARGHWRLAGRACPAVVFCFPALAILWIYSRYDHPLAACLTLACGLAISYAFERVPIRRAPIRMAVFCLLAGMSYWLAGAGAVLVFALMTAVHLLVVHRDWLGALLALPAAAAIAWTLAEYVFVISPKQAFLGMTRQSIEGAGMSSIVLVAMLYAVVPATVLLIWLWKAAFDTNREARARRDKKLKNKKARVTGRSLSTAWAYVIKIAGLALPIVILIGGLYFTCDATHKQVVEINALARVGRWSDALEVGRRLPRNVYNIHCNHDIDRALYHRGRLGYDMLRFPQNPHALLLTHDRKELPATQLKMCDAYIELGNVDMAQKLISEFLVDKGCLGIALEKLARINIIKGLEDTARVYLNVLKKDLAYRGRAEQMLSGLDHGFSPAEAADISRIRSYIRTDTTGRLATESIEEMLTGLLAHNGQNRMAFEYLMACYLLAGRLDGIADNIARVKDLGYPEIPTLYEEAMLIYLGARRQRLNLKELNIKPQTLERYKRFIQLGNAMQQQNSQAVYQQLLQEFGDSYFFYYRFAIVAQAARR
ncbi:MAG: hypothetical protein JW741_11510 [Sedimentisphaerales bacterium]|nr:hypothetical protein [Sedimentisphaerales bacterium]